MEYEVHTTYIEVGHDSTMYVLEYISNTRSSGPVPVPGSEQTGRPRPALNSSRVATLGFYLQDQLTEAGSQGVRPAGRSVGLDQTAGPTDGPRSWSTRVQP